MIALHKGHVQVEAVRVTDLTTNDSVDIRDLPDIVVKEKVMPSV